jgi:hypothetical protein
VPDSPEPSAALGTLVRKEFALELEKQLARNRAVDTSECVLQFEIIPDDELAVYNADDLDNYVDRFAAKLKHTFSAAKIAYNEPDFFVFAPKLEREQVVKLSGELVSDFENIGRVAFRVADAGGVIAKLKKDERVVRKSPGFTRRASGEG